MRAGGTKNAMALKELPTIEGRAHGLVVQDGYCKWKSLFHDARTSPAMYDRLSV